MRNTAVLSHVAPGSPASRAQTAAGWAGVFAMTLCAFTLITSEFMPVSLLTPIMGSLNISEGMAGRGLTISSIFAVVTSLSISALAGTMNRKTLLLIFTVLMATSAIVIATSTTYWAYLAGRAIIGIVVGGFWSMSTATAIRLVPMDQVPRAMAIVNLGNVIGLAIASPIDAYLGSIIGWRGVFFCLVPLSALVLIMQWLKLPSMPITHRQPGSGNVFRLLKTPAVALGMFGCGTFFMGQFTLFTYIRPFLEQVTGLDVLQLSSTLLVMGMSGLAGSVLVAFIIKRALFLLLLGVPTLMAAIAVALIFFGSSFAVVVVLIGVWGMIATSLPGAWWAWLARTLPDNAEAGGGLMVALIQLSIGFGAAMGGVLFDAMGYRATFTASAVVLLTSASLMLLASRMQIKQTAHH